jgi:hypothetical protein
MGCRSDSKLLISVGGPLVSVFYRFGIRRSTLGSLRKLSLPFARNGGTRGADAGRKGPKRPKLSSC